MPCVGIVKKRFVCGMRHILLPPPPPPAPQAGAGADAGAGPPPLALQLAPPAAAAYPPGARVVHGRNRDYLLLPIGQVGGPPCL